MPDKIKDAYEAFKDTQIFIDENDFREQVKKDPKGVFDLFNEEESTKGVFVDYNDFESQLGLKKKETFGLGFGTASEASASTRPQAKVPFKSPSETNPNFTKPQPRLSAEEQQAQGISAKKGYTRPETEGTQLDVILANQKAQNIPLEQQMTSKEMTAQLDRMMPSTQGAEATQAFDDIFKKDGRQEELQGIDEIDFKKFLSATGVSEKYNNAKMEYDLSDKERYSLIQKYNQSKAEKAVQDLTITKARLTSNPAFEQYQQMQEQASSLQNEIGSMGIDENNAKVKSPEEIAQYNELVAQYNDMRQQAKAFAQESGIEADLMDLNEFLENRDFALLGSRLLIDKYPNLLKEKQLQEKADAEYEERRARFKQGDLSVLPTSAMYVGASAINALNRNFYNSLAALVDNFGKLNDNTYSLGDWASKGLTELANNQIITPRKEFSKSGYNIDGYIVTKDESGSMNVYDKDFTPVKVDPTMAAKFSNEYDKKESKGADKETMYDFFSLTPQLADQFVTMYSLVGGGRLAQAGLQSLSKKAISKNTGLTASSYLMSYEDYKNSAIERGLSETDAHLFASLSAMTTSLLEGISPNENIIPKGQAAKALEAFTASVGSPIKTRMKAVAEALVVEPSKEILQEITQIGGDIVVETAANAALGKDVFDASTDMDEIRNTAVLTFGTTALAQLPTSQMFSTKDKKEWWQWASKDVDALVAQVQEDVQNGLYSEDKAQIIIEKAQSWAATQGKIPEGTEDVKRAQITPLLIEKQELLKANESLDKVFQKKNNERINAIDSEIVGIMNTPVSEFTKDEATPEEKAEIETITNGTQETEETPSSETVTDTIVSDGSATPTTVESTEVAPEVVSETVSDIEPPVVEQTTTDVGGVTTPDVSEALKDVESTAKALDGVDRKLTDTKSLKDVKIVLLEDANLSATEETKSIEVINENNENDSWDKALRKGAENLGNGWFRVGKTNQGESVLYSPQKNEAIVLKGAKVDAIAVHDFAKNNFGNPKKTAEAYHKAKADGSNPELVKAVEELLGKPSESARKADNLAVSDIEYNNFIDTGEVSQETIEVIADKITKGQPITERETSIYQAKASEIEQLLGTKEQTPTTKERTEVDAKPLEIKGDATTKEQVEENKEQPSESARKSENLAVSEREKEIQLLDTKKKIAQLEKELRKAPSRPSKGKPSQKQLRTQIRNYRDQLRELEGKPPRFKPKGSVLTRAIGRFQSEVDEGRLSNEERLVLDLIGRVSESDKDVMDIDPKQVANQKKKGVIVKDGLTIDQIVADFISENELSEDMAQDLRDYAIDFLSKKDAYEFMREVKERESTPDPDAVRDDEYYGYGYQLAEDLDMTVEEQDLLESEVAEILLSGKQLTDKQYAELQTQFAEEIESIRSGQETIDKGDDTKKGKGDKIQEDVEIFEQVLTINDTTKLKSSKKAKIKEVIESKADNDIISYIAENIDDIKAQLRDKVGLTTECKW